MYMSYTHICILRTRTYLYTPCTYICIYVVRHVNYISSGLIVRQSDCVHMTSIIPINDLYPAHNFISVCSNFQIVGAGLGLPLLGNIIGLIAASIFRQPMEDCIAISIEIGVQNTALTLFLLTFSLEPPIADISMIIPIAVSILTPVPMVIFIIIKRTLMWQVKWIFLINKVGCLIQSCRFQFQEENATWSHGRREQWTGKGSIVTKNVQRHWLTLHSWVDDDDASIHMNVRTHKAHKI